MKTHQEAIKMALISKNLARNQAIHYYNLLLENGGSLGSREQNLSAVKIADDLATDVYDTVLEALTRLEK